VGIFGKDDSDIALMKKYVLAFFFEECRILLRVVRGDRPAGSFKADIAKMLKPLGDIVDVGVSYMSLKAAIVYRLGYIFLYEYIHVVAIDIMTTYFHLPYIAALEELEG
jgi:hypothetical protein